MSNTRLNNLSQPAGFAKQDDLICFLKELCNIDYKHMPDLAPTKETVGLYKKKKSDYMENFKQYGLVQGVVHSK